MNQTTTTTTATTNPVDSEALRLQLEEDGKEYDDKPDSQEVHEKLIQTLQTSDCREIIVAVVDRDILADAFVSAANRNHVDVLEAFLNHGMKVDVKDKDGCTALIGASCNECEECVRFLFERNASVDVQNNFGYTGLLYASECGHSKIVEILLENNANPDLQIYNGMTALMTASSYAFKEIVQLLLDHGADIELKSNDGKTALDMTNDEEIKELLLNHVNTSYALK